MTKNVREQDLYNGDTGVVVSAPDGSAVAVFATGSGPRDYSHGFSRAWSPWTP